MDGRDVSCNAVCLISPLSLVHCLWDGSCGVEKLTCRDNHGTGGSRRAGSTGGQVHCEVSPAPGKLCTHCDLSQLDLYIFASKLIRCIFLTFAALPCSERVTIEIHIISFSYSLKLQYKG